MVEEPGGYLLIAASQVGEEDKDEEEGGGGKLRSLGRRMSLMTLPLVLKGKKKRGGKQRGPTGRVGEEESEEEGDSF